MQKFTYHTHTNSLGIFDGTDTAEEMIKAAEDKGFEEIGISNHIEYHPCAEPVHPQVFNDANKALDAYKKVRDEVRNAGEKAKIKVLLGYEVDYFSSPFWLENFKHFQEELQADYYIGASHFLTDKTETKLLNLYHLHKNKFSAEEFLQAQVLYWEKLCTAVHSGLFNFMAHLDVCKLFSLCCDESWNRAKEQAVAALAECRMPCEINTIGIIRCGETYPAPWIIKKLVENNVSLLISDDAHVAKRIGENFDFVENMLLELKCTNRWHFTKK